jgi:hypothetical protein
MSLCRTAGFRAWMVAAVVAATCALAAVGPPASAGQSVPYTDSGVQGLVTLCDRDGHRITSGNIHDQPFIWRAVGDHRAPAPYDGSGRIAALMGFQPRKGVTPGQWNGELLAGPSSYSDPDHPIDQFTDLDYPLAVYLDRWPPQVDGFVQLRLGYGIAGEPYDTTTYAAADIQVTGDTWHAVREGNAPCDSGTAISSEVGAIPHFQASARAARVKEERRQARAAGNVAVAPDAGVSPQPTTSPAASLVAARTDVGGGGSAWLLWLILVAIIGGVAFIGTTFVRRRNGVSAAAGHRTP